MAFVRRLIEQHFYEGVPVRELYYDAVPANVDKNVVVDQSPDVGAAVPPGATITINVGSGSTAIPEVTKTTAGVPRVGVTGGSALFLGQRPYVGSQQYAYLFDCGSYLDPSSCREDHFWRGVRNTLVFTVALLPADAVGDKRSPEKAGQLPCPAFAGALPTNSASD